MSHTDDEPTTEWGRYVKTLTERPNWSVARLARESGIARETLFRWIRGSSERVTVDSVKRITDAAGDNLDDGLHAAAGRRPDTTDHDDLDFEIAMILQSDLPPWQKEELVAYVRSLQARQQAEQQALRDRQRAERRQQISQVMNIARGGPQPT